MSRNRALSGLFLFELIEGWCKLTALGRKTYRRERMKISMFTAAVVGAVALTAFLPPLKAG